MPHKNHLPLLAGAVGLAALLAGCISTPVPEPSEQTASPSVTAEPPSPDETAAPAATPRPTSSLVDLGYGVKIPTGGPGDCDASAYVLVSFSNEGTIAEVLLPENLVDMGERTFAEGEVGYNEQGDIATYTVAAGDVVGVIGERFCLYNGATLEALNGYKSYESIQPGDVLVLNPAAVPGFKYQRPES